MSRVDDILTRARDSLGDHAKQRWSDARLIRLIDEAQRHIATEARLLRTKVPMNLLIDISEYELPSDALIITRAVDSTGKPIDIVSHDIMDELDPLWETRTGTAIEKIIFDKQNPRWFKVYPIPTESDSGEVFIASDYGIVTFIEFDIINGDYGIVTEISESALDEVTFNSPYGVVVGMSEYLANFYVYYCQKPLNVVTTNTLQIDDKWDKAIKHYVVGMCWRDDLDTQNRQVGNEEYGLFTAELNAAKKLSSKNNVAASAHQTSYNPGI